MDYPFLVAEDVASITTGVGVGVGAFDGVGVGACVGVCVGIGVDVGTNVGANVGFGVDVIVGIMVGDELSVSTADAVGDGAVVMLGVDVGIGIGSFASLDVIVPWVDEGEAVVVTDKVAPLTSSLLRIRLVKTITETNSTAEVNKTAVKRIVCLLINLLAAEYQSSNASSSSS